MNKQHDPELLNDVKLEELPDTIQEAVERAGWKELMPVQAKTIPHVMAGHDLMVQSRTGSGKTGAFILPMIENLDSRKATCQALVLAPTRELAHQVEREAQILTGDAGLRSIAVYGGVGYGKQLEAFRKGAHIVVGTPGRILDHLLRRSLNLDNLRYLVFDEADRMLSMGFYPDMRELQKYLPEQHIQSCMFSATYPAHVKRLANEFLDDPIFLGLSEDRVHVAETEHVFYVVPRMDKDRSLVRIIEVENPASAIIFCNTKAQVEYVATVLQRFGYDAEGLTADLRQNARERILDHVRAGTRRFLVATDLAARGIDISELSHVIIYEPPDDPEGYIHRAGRTGRAGASGQAISLVFGQEQTQLKRIGARYGIELHERIVPTDKDVEKIVSERLTAMLESRLRQRDKLQVERMQRFVPLAKELGDSDDEISLVAMLLDDYYQETLHAPQLQPVTSPGKFRVDKDKGKSPGKPRRRTRSRSDKGKRGKGSR